jgi:small conductance mechanosensitive channel
MDFYRIIEQKVITWAEELIALLPNFALAALVLILGIFLAKKIRNLSANLINRVSDRAIVNNLFVSFMHIFSLAVVFFAVLSILQLDKAVTSLLAGAGILGLALAFAFQDIAANVTSGIMITFRRPIHVGDLIETNGYMGRVKDVNLRDTIVETLQGEDVIIPNKDLFQNSLKNYSLTMKRRLDIDVGISYAEDLESVRQITLEALQNVPHRSERDVQFYYTDFGDSSIDFQVCIWLNTHEQPKFREARSEAIISIKKAFNQHGITIPFPIRTMDFGIKGGMRLQEQLSAANNVKSLDEEKS